MGVIIVVCLLRVVKTLLVKFGAAADSPPRYECGPKSYAVFLHTRTMGPGAGIIATNGSRCQ